VRKTVEEDGTKNGEGERFWVSEKNEPASFQPQTNNNKQNIKIEELSREAHLVQMTTKHHLFADQENSTHFQPRMRLKEPHNTKGITAAATQELIKN
jgi:hypothetical protein